MEKKELKCEGCGKVTDKAEIQYVQIQGCCSTQNVPLCKDCWEEFHKKNQSLK